jgi:hypothetical protein
MCYFSIKGGAANQGGDWLTGVSLTLTHEEHNYSAAGAFNAELRIAGLSCLTAKSSGTGTPLHQRAQTSA